MSIKARSNRRSDATSGLREDALRLGQFLHTGDDLDIGDVLGPSTTITNHLRCRWSICRITNSERTSNSVGTLRFDVVGSLLDGGRNRRAASSLSPKEAYRLIFHKAEINQFLEGLTDLTNQRSPSHGHNNVIREPPSQLFCDLVSDRLRALGVIRTQVDVDDTPVVLIGNQGAKPIDVVIVSIDADEPRTINLSVENLRRLEVCRHEDAGLEPQTGSLRGDRVGEIPG